MTALADVVMLITVDDFDKGSSKPEPYTRKKVNNPFWMMLYNL